ncbi:MAG: hypothetical protein DMG08_22755 [Acidobacteria bacterium]|nr:MAG: hypothetical protein DMG08_22755 [Acidobacteriota bacterium]
MNLFHAMWRTMISLLRSGRLDRDMDEELRFHMERQIDDNIKKGMAPQEARFAALRAFGGVEEELWHDLRYGVRMLRKNPGFTAVAIVTLALCIGANTAIFSLINAVLIRSLPVSRPEQLVLLQARHRGEPRYISYPMYRDLAERQQVFSGVIATSGQGSRRFTLAGSGRQLEQVRTGKVSMNYFAVLGVEPFLGRTFADVPENTAVPEAVISYGFWERQFGRDPAVIGKEIRTTIGNAPDVAERVFTIVGVTPPEFFGETVGDAPEVWVPIAYSITESSLKSRRGSFIQVIGRLKPDVSEPQALAATNVLYQQLLAEEIALGPTMVLQQHRAADYRVVFENAAGGLDRLRRQYSMPLFFLLAAAAVVLLVACSNLANLLLARGTSRSRELAVRLALGAKRSRLVRQLLTESLLLAVAGSALGLVVASFGSTLLVAMITTRAGSVILDAAPDARVLGFALLLSCGTALLFGLVPAYRAAAVGIGPALKLASRNQSAGAGTQRLGRVLVAAQVALSLALVSGAGLLLRSILKLHALDTGFDKANVLLVDVEIHLVPRPQRPALYRQIQQGLRDLPGVRSTSLSFIGLFDPGEMSGSISIEGYEPPPGPPPLARYNAVSHDYFGTVGMKLVAGRPFTDRDVAGAPRVAIVNEAFARAFFGGRNPLGRRIANREKFDSTRACEIVGVVRDFKYNDLRQEARSMFFVPIFQSESEFNSVQARTDANPLGSVEPVRRLILAANPDIEIREFKTLEDQVDRSLTRERLLSKLTSVFGLLALVLAGTGLYGILSYAVARRTQEIGIRMAIGARGAEVRWMLLRDALVLAGIGILSGVPLALASGHLFRSFLCGLTPNDVPTLAGSVVLMLAVAVVAAYLPARRASKVDPILALRYE